jgi:hypothetical protein
MLLIYCADPLHPRQPDSAYLEQVAAAEAAGLAHELISYEALVDDGDAETTVRRIAQGFRQRKLVRAVSASS